MPLKHSFASPIVQPDATGYTHEQEGDIVKFYPPPNPTAEQDAFIADVVSLDHRSLHRFRPSSPERQEVKRLLWNAITAAFERGSSTQARLLYGKAEQAYYDHVQVRNRLRYLCGMGIGIAAATMLGGTLLIAGPLSSFLAPSLLLLILLFAGFGSVASVLSRLSTIDLRQEPSDRMILVSGATKPVVAVIFAIVIFLVFDLKVIDIRVGSTVAGGNNGLYLVTSFLCGFSERFATDLIARVPFGNKT